MQERAALLFDEGNRRLAARDAAGALSAFQEAVSLAPLMGEAHANIAWLLEQAGRHVQAEAVYRRALSLCPQHAQMHLNFGAFLAKIKRFEEALSAYRRVLDLDPQCAAAWSNLSVLHAQLGQLQEAEQCCRRALSIAPDYAKAHINLSYLCLRQGHLDEGWRHYEFRTWQCTLGTELHCPRWAGEPLAGKRVLVGHEAGYGDVIQFCRFAAELKRMGASHVTLVCHPELQALLATLEGVDEVLAGDAVDPAQRWDCWTPLMSLPLHCATRIDSIPAALPYLRAPAADAARWEARLAADLPAHALRVGLVWKGNPKFENDDERSLPSLATLAPLGDVDGVTFVSLQKGPGQDEAIETGALARLAPWGGDLSSFADTAGLVAHLDLIITVDTAVAHLAGALGKPCWILLPHHMPDWRWFETRDDSPWYPGVVRLFRQSRRGDWPSVIEQVRAALERHAAAHGGAAP